MLGVLFFQKVAFMVSIIVPTILTIGLAFFFVGKGRADRLSKSEQTRQHSLPIYHGSYPAILATAPALMLMSFWMVADGFVFNQMLIAQFPSELKIQGRQTTLVLLAQIQNIADGVVVGQPDKWLWFWLKNIPIGAVYQIALSLLLRVVVPWWAVFMELAVFNQHSGLEMLLKFSFWLV